MSLRPTVQMRPIQSSLFDAYHYDPATSRLQVRFLNGDVYVYTDVPPEKAEAFANNQSPGRFFVDRIRDTYLSSKVT